MISSNVKLVIDIIAQPLAMLINVPGIFPDALKIMLT